MNDGRAVLLALFILTIPVMMGGCGRPSADESTIARVGGARLSLADAKRAIDTAEGSFNQQLPRYIAEWVSDELLYQEAQREGIENSDQFHRQMDQTRRQIAVQNLLQQVVYSDTGSIEESTVRAYFNQHASEFFVREDMVKLNVVGFTAREPAGDFAAGISSDNPWSAAVARAKSASGPSIIALPGNQYFSQQTLFPPELWKVATTLNVNEVSFPIKTNIGYFVIQLLAVIPQGKAAELDVVRDEVRERMLIERRRQKYAEYLGTLRKRYDVEVLLNSVSLDDSIRSQHHE